VSIPLFHYVPVLSDIARYFGIISSDYRSIEKTLAKKESVSVLLGGVREMAMVEDFKLRLCIKKRRGIFRLALTTGTPIVPVLTFGENELFSQARSEVLDSINAYLFRTLGMHIPLPTMRSLMNWVELSYRPLKPIRSYTGKPITVKQVVQPTEKEIADLRDAYIKGVQDLFGETAGSEYSLHIE
jgi:2-acylglycerol O-acyltransferase 2